jgi:hypothetical protein
VLRLLSLFLLLAAAACNGPIGLMHGGKLDGVTQPLPTSWDFAGESGQMQIETNPAEPYSVNVNYTIVDDALYVNAGDTRAEWVKNIEANPEVRLRIDGALYDLQAERVTQRVEIARFGEVWTRQSMFLRDPTQFDEVWIYRMVPR